MGAETKVDLRVAPVINAKHIPEAHKLLKLTVSLGGEKRLVVIVAKFAPREMKFGVSEGMVVATGAGGKEVFALAPDSSAKPGHRVH